MLKDIHQEPATPYARHRHEPVFRATERVIAALRAYHDYRAVGVDNIPASGPVLVLCNHSLATYDTLMLAPSVAEGAGREMVAMVDHAVMATPGLRSVFRHIAMVGTRDNARRALRERRVVLNMPGGMRESLRDARARYRIDWDGRLGFARLALETGSPIVLAACPRSDDIYHVYPNPLTGRVYERLKLPLVLFRGVGPTPIPRPVKLRHLVSEPIHPPVAPDRVTDEDVVALHAAVVERMQRLMQDALRLD